MLTRFLAIAVFTAGAGLVHAATSSAYTIDGIQFVVSLAPDKPVATIGDPVTLILRIENRGGRPVTLAPPLIDSSGTRGNARLVEVTSAEGKLVGVPRLWSAGSTTASSPLMIVPAGGFQETRFLLSAWAVFEEPGTYQVRARWRPAVLSPATASAWSGRFIGGRGNPNPFPEGTPIVLAASTEVRIEARGSEGPRSRATPAAAPGEPPVVRGGNRLIVRLDARPADLAAFRDEKGITEVLFTGSGVGPLTYLGTADLANFSNWTELRLLDFGPIPLTDEALAHLVRLSKLEGRFPMGARELNGPWITSAGVESLVRLTSLSNLNLALTRFSDADLARLGAFRQLKELRLAPESTDATLALFKDNAAIEKLYLGNSRVTNAGLSTVARFLNLKTLALPATNQITDAGIATVSRLTSLESLAIGWSPLTDAAVPNLSRLTRLTSLHIVGSSISRIPSNLTELTSLGLPNVPITDAGLRALGDYHRLKSLQITSPKVTDAGLVQLGELGELFSLSLENTAITDVTLDQVARLPKLTYLNLSGTKITNSGLGKLAGLKELSSLDYRGSGATLTRQQAEELIPSLRR